MKFLFYCFSIEFCPCACFAHFGSQKFVLVRVHVLCTSKFKMYILCPSAGLAQFYFGVVMPFPSSSVITGLRNVVFFFVLLLYLLQRSHAFFVPRVRDFDHRVDAFQNQILVSEYAKFRLAHILAGILTSLCDKPRPGA